MEIKGYDCSPIYVLSVHKFDNEYRNIEEVKLTTDILHVSFDKALLMEYMMDLASTLESENPGNIWNLSMEGETCWLKCKTKQNVRYSITENKTFFLKDRYLGGRFNRSGNCLASVDITGGKRIILEDLKC